MKDEEAYDVIINVNGIIDAIRVVARFNKPLLSLAQSLSELAPRASAARAKVTDAVRAGSNVFEALAQVEPKLADACHDFVYQIASPHASVITKNLAREEVCKVVLELS